MKTRKEMIQYILTNGNDTTQTRYTIEDLAYRGNEDLSFILTKLALITDD